MHGIKRKGGEKTKQKQAQIFLPFSDCPKLLQDRYELCGILESVQPYEDGLVHIRVAGLDRLVPDELTKKLTVLRGRFVSVLRIESHFSVAEVPGSMRGEPCTL